MMLAIVLRVPFIKGINRRTVVSTYHHVHIWQALQAALRSDGHLFAAGYSTAVAFISSAVVIDSTGADVNAADASTTETSSSSSLS
jgi:hypothetical protein